MTDAAELDEAAIRARVEAATEGPWEIFSRDLFAVTQRTAVGWDGRRIGGMLARADAEFIAHARTDLPAALDENTRLRAALDEARTTIRQLSGANDDVREVAREWRTKWERAALPARGYPIWRARAEAAESALASIRTLARSWSGCHDLLMTGDSAAHDIETALATPTTTDGETATTEGETA